MGLSLKPDHLRRYRDIAALLLKYGRSDLLFSSGIEGEDGDVASDSTKNLGVSIASFSQVIFSLGTAPE